MNVFAGYKFSNNRKWPFNVRSFFTDLETKDIGSGLVLWRGYFQ